MFSFAVSNDLYDLYWSGRDPYLAALIRKIKQAMVLIFAVQLRDI